MCYGCYHRVMLYLILSSLQHQQCFLESFNKIVQIQKLFKAMRVVSSPRPLWNARGMNGSEHARATG